MTHRRGHGRELAQAAVARGVDLIAAWGGDGTVNEVGSALAFTDIPLAIIPSGSGNGLARELGISRHPARALEDAVGGMTRRIDVGEIAGRLFINIAGCGFDAHIAREFAMHAGRRGPTRYAWLTLSHLMRIDLERSRSKPPAAVEAARRCWSASPTRGSSATAQSSRPTLCWTTAR